MTDAQLLEAAAKDPDYLLPPPINRDQPIDAEYTESQPVNGNKD